MIDLKKIISQLDDTVYQSLEESFTKTKANNSLFLLKNYRNGGLPDGDILNQLNINTSSLYTLKSRLYDKIQDKLTKSESISEEELLKQVNQIHEVCYTNKREIAVAYLTKLEENLKAHDMHGELLVVYSALKQLHLFTDKYFHYSQLYNKQIAFNLTTEKSIEILGNFNRMLMQYDFSKLSTDLDTLLFLHKGIIEQYSLNPSRQIEAIKNIIETELYLFTDAHELTSSFNVPELLNKTQVIIEKVPHYSEQKQWQPILNFLYFEYYFRNGETTIAASYFEKLNSLNDSIANFSNVCLISRFLVSRIVFLQKTKPGKIFELPLCENNLLDSKNIHLQVEASLSNAMILFYQGKHKEAISIINQVVNSLSVKDLHFINVNLKITQSFFYLKRKDFDIAETLLKSTARKIKSDNIPAFSHVNHMIKLLLAETNPKNKLTKNDQSDLLTLFVSKNNNLQLIRHLIFELNKQYNN